MLSYGPPEGLPQFREAVDEWMRSTQQMEAFDRLEPVVRELAKGASVR